MHEDIYQHIERTAKANPYEDYIGIPPPPPRKPRRYLGVFLGIAVLLFSAAGLFAWTYTYHVSTTQPTPIVRFVQVTPTAPLPTQQPTVDPNYTATDVINNFTHAGIRPSYIQYGQTVWSWTADMYYVSVHATSSATWTDDSECTGNCSPIEARPTVWPNNSVTRSLCSAPQPGILLATSRGHSEPVSTTMLHPRAKLFRWFVA